MLNSHSFQVGDTAFYILDDNPFFKIRKTRIAEITKKPSQIFFERYCFLCEDGHCFESVESLVPNFVYPTKNDAVSYIMTQLRTSMEDEKLCIVSTFQLLERLQASLRVYTATSAGHEDAPANPTYAYRIDDDNDHYVIRRTSLKRLLGDLGPGADSRSAAVTLATAYDCPTSVAARSRQPTASRSSFAPTSPARKSSLPQPKMSWNRPDAPSNSMNVI